MGYKLQSISYPDFVCMPQSIHRFMMIGLGLNPMIGRIGICLDGSYRRGNVLSVNIGTVPPIPIQSQLIIWKRAQVNHH